MLTVALSLLFGLVAFAALVQIWVSVGAGIRRRHVILAELSASERFTARRLRPVGRRAFAPA
jgi:hypothetical protein